MTTLAYFVFTFMACILGLGLGLALHHLGWFNRFTVKVNKSAKSPETAEANDDSWEALNQWQAQSNRSFALHISACTALPLLVAFAGFSQRSEVVGVICNSITQVAAQSPLCL